MADTPVDTTGLVYQHPPGFRKRRVRNWFFLGLTYAGYYFCRTNLSIVSADLKDGLGFSNAQYGAIQGARSGAYAIGQFVNGLFTDGLGGKRAMTIGAVGTILLNVAFGLTAWSNIGWLFYVLMLIRLADGYMQAFGAPGMVKINTAWFRRRERGTFAGIFGFMINLGATASGKLGSLLATGFAVPLLFFSITVPKLDWRYMFIIPPVVTGIIVLLMNLAVKNHPEEAGYSIRHDDESDDDDPLETIHIGAVFRKIASNPVVWIVAGAYFCTGFVRYGINDWWVIYMKDVWSVAREDALFDNMASYWLPFTASFGSLGSGIISDKLFAGRRAPVAALLYLIQAVFLFLALSMCMSWIPGSATLACVLIVLIWVGCNSTHSLLGTAAAMDLGGRKMAGFSSGVIDSFQYFGAMLAQFGMGRLLDRTAVAQHLNEKGALVPNLNPTVWFGAMLPLAVLGTILMTYLWLRHRGTDRAGT